MRQLIEYFWDERDQHSYYLYEDERTGELAEERKHHPRKKPEATDELRAEYFAGLKFYLETQPLYD